MLKSRWIRHIGLLTLIVFFLATLTIGWLGVSRYGSVKGAIQRVQSEIAARQPRPTALPTVVPQATVDLAQIAALLDPTPSVRPTQTLPATHTPAPQRGVITPTPWPTAVTPSAPELTFPPLFQAAQPAAYLDGYRHQWQGWNNCAPATISTYLSFWGRTISQDAAAAALKPNEQDKNVTPIEIVALAEQQGVAATWLVNGSPALVKTLVSNGYPVMIETWLEEDPNDGMGHYRLVVGYDESADQWIVSDSYVSKDVELPYRGIVLSDSEFKASWWVFLNTMIVTYPADQAAEINAILGDAADPELMWRSALEEASRAVDADPADGIGWHNLGRALWALGEKEQAVAAFDQARAAGLPWRMFWYQFDALEAYVWAGRPVDVIALTQATIESGGGGEEIYYWKGVAHSAVGQPAEADSAWRYALWWHPAHQPSLDMLNQ